MRRHVKTAHTDFKDDETIDDRENPEIIDDDDANDKADDDEPNIKVKLKRTTAILMRKRRRRKRRRKRRVKRRVKKRIQMTRGVYGWRRLSSGVSRGLMNELPSTWRGKG